MRVISHGNWGHGLRPGTNHDINCCACKREVSAGIAPRITGSDEIIGSDDFAYVTFA